MEQQPQRLIFPVLRCVLASLCALLALPLLILESCLSCLVWHTAFLAALRLGLLGWLRAAWLPSQGACYAAVADVLEASGLLTPHSYTQWQIGTQSAYMFGDFARDNPAVLYEHCGLCTFRPPTTPAPLSLPVGAILIYPRDNACGYSRDHGHIEIVVSRLLRLAASDHIATIRAAWDMRTPRHPMVLVPRATRHRNSWCTAIRHTLYSRLPATVHTRLTHLPVRVVERHYQIRQALRRRSQTALAQRSPDASSLQAYLRSLGYHTVPPGITCCIPRALWRARAAIQAPGTIRWRRIVVHHSYRRNAAWVAPDIEVRRIQARHLVQGFTDIGYHFLISPCGTVYEGRAGGKHIRGEHAFGFNGDSVSICLLGRYDDVEPADMLHLDAPNGQALIRLCLWLLQEIGASPGQVVPVAPTPTIPVKAHAIGLSLPVIVGHCDLDALLDLPGTTTCPGARVQRQLSDVRQHLSQAWNELLLAPPDTEGPS